MADQPDGLPDFSAAITAVARSKKRNSPCHTNRASSLGHRCLRYLVYERTHWQERQPVDDYLQGIFETGKVIEDAYRKIIVDVEEHLNGCKVLCQQQFSQWARYKITGHSDGILVRDQAEIAGFELKTVGQRYPHLRTVDDLRRWDISYRWLGQAQAYMILAPLPRWLLLLVNKQNIFDTRSIWLELDYGFAESLVHKAELINGHVDAGTLPCKLNDPNVCRRCPHELHCLPDIRPDQTVKVIDDDALVGACIARAECEGRHLLWGTADSIIKAQVKERLPQGGVLLVGDWELEGKALAKQYRVSIRRRRTDKEA